MHWLDAGLLDVGSHAWRRPLIHVWLGLQSEVDVHVKFLFVEFEI